MDPRADARTTPTWAQPFGLALLVALSIYHLACFHYALDRRSPPQLWWGTWQMFTTLDDTTEVLEGEAFYDGAWHPFDPLLLFPYQWESGPRYARSAFYDSSGKMRILAASTCRRFERPIEKVKYTLVTWKRTPGTMERPPGAREKALITWTCGSALVKLPLGRVL
jgi:hypothetical protein